MVKNFLKKCNTTDIIFITDISIDSTIIKLLDTRHKAGQPIYFIDHHENNEWMNKYEWAYVFPAKNGVKTCATTLIVEFLEDKFFYESSIKMKSYIELVRSYDVWDWKAEGNTNAKKLNDLFFLGSFQEFVDNTYEWLTEYPNEEFSFPDNIEFLLAHENKKIQKYLESKDKEMRKGIVCERQVGIVYAENYQSELGNYLAEIHLDVDFIILINLSSKKASVRSVKVDCNCNLFAANFGGGGHPQASGFLLNEENIHQLIFM
jgi:oligoribonuclease NrnB/cAMP/cGMP phosphodiesterase (DHH superfamily)